jgi:transcription initiation factor TFIID TATA-box-binding protein
MAEKRYDSLKIENVVASGVIAESIDLNEVSSKIKSCELNTKRFPGAVYRIENPKIASLIFSSGKVVLTGIRDDKALKDGLAIIIKSLKEAGVDTLDVPRVAVTNIVCSYDIGKYINLNKVVVTLNLENIEYEPEQFPGLVYRIKDPKIVALLFSSGKIILTGGKNLDDIKKGLDFLEQKLESIM